MPNFHGNQLRLIVDVETYSEVDLAKAGPHAYAEHPSTGVHVVNYLLKKAGVVQWREQWIAGKSPPTLELLRTLRNPAVTVVAHNWLFEFNIWREIFDKRYCWPSIAMDRWSCTMARALYHGLPASLDQLGPALGLAHQKDRAARANMLKLAKPRSIGPNGPTWWKDDPEKGPTMLANLYAYCAQDVETENEADDALPELPSIERKYFLVDGRINQRGITIDTPFVQALQAITDQQAQALNAELAQVTAGAIKTVSQTKAMTAWLDNEGYQFTSLDKESIKDALPSVQRQPARRVLQLRQEGAKASTAKLKSMLLSRSNDGRARGLLQYYGAGRTGRWAGRRIQPQNFPRGVLKPAALASAVEGVRNQGWDAEALDLLMPCTPMDACATMLRGCLIPAPGKALISVDLAQIEARVIAWLAGQQDILDVFESGQDVYVYTAAKVGSKDRQLGKVLVLACGFGMGKDRFRETALTYGLKLTQEEAGENVQGWREANPKIVAFWYALDAAFRRAALASSGYEETVGMLLTVRKTGRAVRIRLPSMRELVYQEARIIPGEDGERDSIAYDGLDQYTRQWGTIRTYGGKLAENVTQAVARDVMAQALDTIEETVDGLDVIGSIHDEGLMECDASVAQAGLLAALLIFKRIPGWAPGLPVGAEGWIGERYRKG